MKREYGARVEDSYGYYFAKLQLLFQSPDWHSSESLAKQLEIAEELRRRETQMRDLSHIRRAALMAWILNDRVDRVEEQMKLFNPVTELIPNNYFFLIMMWHRLGNIDKVCDTFVESHKMGHRQDTESYNYILRLVSSTAKENDKTDGLKMMEKMVSVMESCDIIPSLETYKILFCQYTDDKETIEALLKQMIAQNIAPDTHVFTSLISATDPDDIKRRTLLHELRDNISC